MGCLHTSRWFLLFLQAFTPCWTMHSIVQYDYEQRPFLNTKYNFSYTRGVPRHTKEIAKRYFFRMPHTARLALYAASPLKEATFTLPRLALKVASPLKEVTFTLQRLALKVASPQPPLIETKS